jgi:hypothetical protein
MQFSIKGNQEIVTIDVQSRTYPHSDEYWDGNWINSTIEVVVPGYRAYFCGELRTDEIFQFLQDLKEMYNSLSGFAKLNSMEGLIELYAEINPLGKLQWTGKTTYPIGIGNTLEFRLCNDQSFVPNLISELQLVMKQFPVIGKL